MKSPIRVLHVLGRLNNGGAESRTMDVYRAIDKSRIQFDFAIHTEQECYYSNEVRKLGGRIFVFPRFNGKNLLEYKKAWDIFFKTNPEYKIVHGHITTTAFIYLRSAKKNNVPIRIAHARSAQKSNKIRALLAKLAKYSANYLLAVSKLAALSEFGEKAMNKENVKIIPNAIDAKKYSYNVQRRLELRKSLDLSNNLVLGHVGSFRYPKNHDFLIDIFKEVKEIRATAKLMLVGEGELRNKITKKVDALGLSDSVIFTGIRNDIPDLLQVIDILIFPSIYEGFPGVVLEAQAAGLPCVISDSITKEIELTNLITYCSIKDKPKVWSEIIIKQANIIDRQLTYNLIQEKGYDINSVSNWYLEFYSKVFKYDQENC